MTYLLPLLTILIWAGNTIVTKVAADWIAPAEIGFYRWLLAGLLFTPFLLRPVLANRRVIAASLGKIAVLGVLGMALYQSAAYFAATRTSATHMAIIMSLVPIITLAMTIVSLKQRLTYGALIGAVVSFLGVLLVVSQGDLGLLASQGVNEGDLVILIAGIAYAGYGTLLKKWHIPIPPLQLLYLQIVVAVIAQFPLFAMSEKTGLNSHNIPLVLYACIPTSMLAPWLWMKAIALLGPSRAMLCFNLLPILTILLAALTLGEHLAIYHVYGGLLTLGGVVLAERWRTPLRATTPKAQRVSE